MSLVPEIFISYVNDNGSLKKQLINYLIKDFETAGFNISSNPIDLTVGGEITSFASDYKPGKYALFIVDNQYITSKVALSEIMASFDYFPPDRMFFIFMPDVKYFQGLNFVDAYYYWDKDYLTYRKVFETSSNHHVREDAFFEMDFLRRIRRIFANISAMSDSYVVKTASDINFVIGKLIDDIFIKIYKDEEKRTQLNKPVYLNVFPAVRPDDFFGLDNLTDEIERKLSENRVVSITGDSKGIGKTSLAGVFINTEKYYSKYKYIAWVYLSTNVRTDMLMQLTPAMGQQLRSNNQQENFKILINELNKIIGRKLIVFDNVRNNEQAREILKIFKDSDWYIMFVSDNIIDEVGYITVGSLKKECAVKLFYKFYKKDKNDTILSYLIDLFDNNALIIKLAARFANARKDMNILKLYTHLQKVNLEQEANINDQDFDSAIFIDAIFKLDNFLENELHFLTCLSVLPDGDFNLLQLKRMTGFEDMPMQNFLNMIDDIELRGWINRNNNQIGMQPVIKEILYSELRPDDNKCKPLIEYLEKNLIIKDLLRIRNSLYVADYLIAKITVKSGRITKLINIMADYYFDRKEYRKTLQYYFKSLDIYKKYSFENKKEIADLYNNISIAYSHLGDANNDLKYSKKALELRLEATPDDLALLAESYNNVAIAYRDTGQFDKALQYHFKDIELNKKISSVPTKDLAASYYETSVTYYYQRNYKKAKEYIEKAISVWEKTSDKDNPDLNYAYDILLLISKKI